MMRYVHDVSSGVGVAVGVINRHVHERCVDAREQEANKQEYDRRTRTGDDGHDSGSERDDGEREP
jgi:hypothetical protein